MSRSGNIWRYVDWLTVALWGIMMIFGWLNIYGASYNFDQTSIISFDNFAGKQFVWIGTAIILALILLLIDSRTYEFISYPLYVFWIFVLILTAFVSTNIKGSHSWLTFGPVSVQPAEFAKCFTALALAKFMSRYGYEVRSLKNLFIPFVLIGLPTLIIMVLQQETGSALVFVAFLIMLYREGMTGYILMFIVAAAIFFIIVIKYGAIALPFGFGNVGTLVAMLLIIAVILYFLLFKFNMKKESIIVASTTILGYAIGLVLNIWWPMNFNIISMVIVGLCVIETCYFAYSSRIKQVWFLALFSVISVAFCSSCDYAFENVLQPHQKVRIEVLLGIKDDPSGVGYNVKQAKIAIGSGGFFGKGYLQGTQTKLKYVPEQHTDFIFCTVGEEWGFLGSLFLLGLYTAFILRLIYLAERQKEIFSRIYGYSVACIFFMHLMINIGMVIGFLPVIGIPLPFFSYGGSSLWGFTLLLFIFLKRDAARVEQWR